MAVGSGRGDGGVGGGGQWWWVAKKLPNPRKEARSSKGRLGGLIVGERLSAILRALLAEIKWGIPLNS